MMLEKLVIHFRQERNSHLKQLKKNIPDTFRNLV